MGKKYSGHKNIGIAVLLVIILAFFLPIATCDENEMLLNGTGIYLTTGETWNFEQGYKLKVKSVNPTENMAWVELSLNGETLHEGIMSEGETLAYSHNREILNITMDTIYSSPSGELVTFTPVYQYLDPELPAPETDKGTEDDKTDDNASDINEGDITLSIPGFRAVFTLATIAILTYCMNKKK